MKIWQIIGQTIAAEILIRESNVKDLPLLVGWAMGSQPLLRNVCVEGEHFLTHLITHLVHLESSPSWS